VTGADLLEWRLDPVLSGGVLAAAVAYLAGARRVRRWPPGRTAAFCGGLLLLFVTLQSGLHHQGEELLSAHMVQHLLLTLAVPPLLLSGAPLALALRALPEGPRRALARALRGRAVHALTHPVVAWTAFTAALLAVHVPAFYEASLRSEAVHGVEHAVLLAASLLFWLPLLAVEPAPHRPSPAGRVLSLLLAMPPMALVGVALLSSSTVVYDPYLATARELGVSALADQRAAGTVMWVGGTLALVAATLAVGWAALRREEERQRAREAYADGRQA
jgi:putative membrane protein